MRYDCPLPDFQECFIVLPDEWLGVHAQRRDQAVEAAKKYNSPTLTQFAAAVALLDDWVIPGMNGNPAMWDFTKLDMRLIAWVSETALIEFAKVFVVPKAFSSPLRSG